MAYSGSEFLDLPQDKPKIHIVEIGAPSRLHLGFMDMAGELGRKFSSLGITLDAPQTRIVCRRAETNAVSGPSSERASKVLEKMRDALGVSEPVEITIQSAIPEHVGLGSGTQMSLAVGLGTSHLWGKPLSPRQIAATLDRGARSGIGVASFEKGGVILDGGRGANTDVPPIISRLPWPEDWRIILISDDNHIGLSGQDELTGFKTLPPFTSELAGCLCRLMVMQILPALAEEDLNGFGSGVTQLQNKMGDHFAAAQGGRYTSPHIAAVFEALSSQGIQGFGQSSWGPTGFILIKNQVESENLLRTLTDGRYSPLKFTLCRGQNTGGTIACR